MSLSSRTASHAAAGVIAVESDDESTANLEM